MARYAADLHIHTVLSPCAEVEMIPPFIVSRAIDVGLEMIAISDHNSAENVQAVMEAASGTSLRVLPGIECESSEGLHLLCLFDEAESALCMQETVYESLPDILNIPEKFGAQFVVDATGDYVESNERLLLAPTMLTMEQIVGRVLGLGGMAVPAHIDRPSYGLYSVLGFLPDEPQFGAVEISRHLTPQQALIRFPDLRGKLILQSSDAHRLEEIGTGVSMLEIRHRTVKSIVEASVGFGTDA